jgi:hypothetical protein
MAGRQGLSAPRRHQLLSWSLAAERARPTSLPLGFASRQAQGHPGRNPAPAHPFRQVCGNSHGRGPHSLGGACPSGHGAPPCCGRRARRGRWRSGPGFGSEQRRRPPHPASSTCGQAGRPAVIDAAATSASSPDQSTREPASPWERRPRTGLLECSARRPRGPFQQVCGSSHGRGSPPGSGARVLPAVVRPHVAGAGQTTAIGHEAQLEAER